MVNWHVERITQVKLYTDIKRWPLHSLRSESHNSTDNMILFIKNLYLYVYRKMHVRVYTKLYISITIWKILFGVMGNRVGETEEFNNLFSLDNFQTVIYPALNYIHIHTGIYLQQAFLALIKQ